MVDSEKQKPFLLIVDDNPTNLDVLIEILQLEYRLGVVKSGEKALEFVQKKIPDLILLDIEMPGKNGFEICRSFKSRSETKLVPVVFISSNYSPENVSKCFSVGGADYLSKPFNSLEVKSRIKDQLDLRSFRHGL